MEEDERYLGGFDSSYLYLKKWRLWLPGAGIYATDKKLVLTGDVNQDLSFDASLNELVIGWGWGNLDPSNLTPDQNRRIVKTLSGEHPKQKHVLRRDQISSMEIKQPPGLFHTGYLRVLLLSGETIHLKISRKKEYERILSLLQSFDPQVLRQVT